jgi:hypothetical protein
VITADQFALNLIRQTVTTDRVAAVMARIAGDRIEVGPLRFGPGGAVAATGVGLIGVIEVTPASGRVPGAGSMDRVGSVGFDARVPGDLTIDLTAGSGGRVHRYEGSVVVSLRITVVVHAPARVVLDVAALQADDVAVALNTTGMATFVLQTLGDADREVAAQVAKVVNDRVAAVADIREIDFAALLDRAWPAEMAELEARLGG